MSTVGSLLSTNTDLLWAALVSAVVSAGVSYWFKRRETRHTAEVEYEYEERKRLRALIGRHHGRLVNAANSMNYRMWNLYANYDRGWLDVQEDYSNPHAYYFRSSVFRFLNVCALVRQLESEAVLLDARIARKADFVFLNYAAALHWVMTDVALTEGMSYDTSHQTDHFFSDHFRQYCDLCLRDGTFLSVDDLSARFVEGSPLEAVLRYFDGLTPDEERLRWDRLVAFHLLMMAFINSFGYKRQYSSSEHFVRAAREIRNHRILENLALWIPRHDLGDDREAKKIISAARFVCRSELRKRTYSVR